MSLENDAGDVRGEGVAKDDEGPWPGGPKDEAGDDEDLRPVRRFAATGFGAESGEEFGSGGFEAAFGEATEPRCGVREVGFPTAQAE